MRTRCVNPSVAARNRRWAVLRAIVATGRARWSSTLTIMMTPGVPAGTSGKSASMPGAEMGVALRLWCATCGRGIVVERKPYVELPDCATCGPTTWTTADAPDDQKYPYVLNHNDKRFLRSIRVSGDE